MGFAHHGTCSLEKYMIDRGMDVVRVENGFKYLKYINKIKDFKERTQIYMRDTNKPAYKINGIVLQLHDMKLNPNFPHLNKNDCLSIR